MCDNHTYSLNNQWHFWMYFRSKLLDLASLLTEASQDSSGDVIGPVWDALHAAVRNGLAAASGSHPEPVNDMATLSYTASIGFVKYLVIIAVTINHLHPG